MSRRAFFSDRNRPRLIRRRRESAGHRRPAEAVNVLITVRARKKLVGPFLRRPAFRSFPTFRFWKPVYQRRACKLHAGRMSASRQIKTGERRRRRRRALNKFARIRVNLRVYDAARDSRRGNSSPRRRDVSLVPSCRRPNASPWIFRHFPVGRPATFTRSTLADVEPRDSKPRGVRRDANARGENKRGQILASVR